MFKFIQRRAFSVSRTLMSGTKPTPKSDAVLSESIPGFREPGAVATDYEVASGLERYELLKKLRGEDPWDDLHPIKITEKGTVKTPIVVKGVDDERYIGCTGFPADSHTITFLTLRPGSLDRCSVCGNVFKVSHFLIKYIQEKEEHHS